MTEHASPGAGADGVPVSVFEEIYAAREKPPWETGRPQPVFVALAKAGRVTAPVLDIGCGTGDNALMLASHGLSVTGIDLVESALAGARGKAARLGASVEFLRHDAVELARLGRTFATAIDSGMFHGLSDEQRPQFTAGLRTVLTPGGMYFLLCFSEHETREGGPRRLTQAELQRVFCSASGFEVVDITPARFEANIFEGGAAAWLAEIRRS